MNTCKNCSGLFASFKMLGIFLLAAAMLFSGNAFGQIGLPNTTAVTENFNTMGATATASLPANWKMSSAGTGATSNWLTATNVSATTIAAS